MPVGRETYTPNRLDNGSKMEQARARAQSQADFMAKITHRETRIQFLGHYKDEPKFRTMFRSTKAAKIKESTQPEIDTQTEMTTTEPFIECAYKLDPFSPDRASKYTDRQVRAWANLVETTSREDVPSTVAPENRDHPTYKKTNEVVEPRSRPGRGLPTPVR